MGDDSVRPGMYAGLASEYLKKIDEAVKRGEDRLAGTGRKMSCYPGCSSCCRLPLQATIPEAELAASYVLDTFPADRLVLLKEKGAAWLAWCEDSLPGHVRGGLDEADAYSIHGPGCPFLEGGLCSIYAVRPMGCRVHNSTHPPELCRPDIPYDSITGCPGTVMEVLMEVKPLCMGYRKSLEDMGVDFESAVGSFAEQVLGLLKK